VTKITRHTVPNFLNFTSSLLVLFFVQPFYLETVINCRGLLPLHSYRTAFWSQFCLLDWTAPCWQTVWRVIFKIRVIFGVRFQKKVDKKANLIEGLKW